MLIIIPNVAIIDSVMVVLLATTLILQFVAIVVLYVLYYVECVAICSRLDTVRLDGQVSSLTGSLVGPDEHMESLDWKSTFRGEKETRVEGVIIKMTFKRKGKEFRMTGLLVTNLKVDGDFQESIVLKTTTTKGYDVSAPTELSYACYEYPGMFPPDPKAESNRNRKYLAGLTFPEMRLQVFDVESPNRGNRWYCGNFMGIGLWVGILVTLFFALVLYWGFSMLASINTMDRFGNNVLMRQTCS